jgi:hypothetical protein
MPRVGFEPTTPVLEREKTAHALDSTATVLGSIIYSIYNRNEGGSWSVSDVNRYIIFTNLLDSIMNMSLGWRKLCIHRKIPLIKKKL